MNIRYLVICFLASGFFFSCSSDKKETKLPEGVGINLSYMDTTTKPSDDFFQYVNGGWLAANEIPADQGNWGSFTELRETNQEVLLNILNKAGENEQYKEGSDQRKAANFYSVGMDSLLAERAGVSVLKSYLESIASIRNKKDLQDYLEQAMLRSGNAFFDMGVFPDLKKSDRIAAYITSGGIGLPERDYYLKSDDKSKEIRNRYIGHIANLFILSGASADDAKQKADVVLEIETRLARNILSKEDSRDPYKSYHPKSISDLGKLAPSVDWKDYFTELNIKVDTVIVTEPAFLQEYDKIVKESKFDEIKSYLEAALLRTSAPFMNHDFVEESFNFNQKYLTGIEQLRPRWKRVLTTTNNVIGEAIGQLYVDETFPPEAKQKALEMVENIKLAFADRIKQLDWMSDSTKDMALKKLNTFTVKIGYPEKWIDYSTLEVSKDPEKASYFQNVVNANQFESKRQLSKLGKPVDRDEWQMTPQTINAYYNPLFNEIVFPAAILQPPFYDYRADEAVNYGGIGSVIGHEISHGFDDQGAQFDAQGNLKNWFTEKDLSSFKAKGKSLAGQFDKYEPLPGVFVQGQFTLGENIGDLGGITAAYEGLLRFYREHGKPDPIEGFTPEQRFFISWATIWRIKYRDETLRTQVLTNPHSPGMFRANGPLTNFTPFYEAFNVKEGDKMFRTEEERVKIW
ncbi:MAG: M13 family metallopeptidase [Cyclobacteriaceae bacterium]